MLAEAKLLTEAIEKFKERYPDVPLSFVQETPYQLVQSKSEMTQQKSVKSTNKRSAEEEMTMKVN